MQDFISSILFTRHSSGSLLVHSQRIKHCPLWRFFFSNWTSVLKAALREFQRGASSQGGERLHSLKYRSSSVFVFRNLSSYPETILYLRKHLVLRTALGPLRRSSKCTYGDSWGERRRNISQTKAYCFLSHWLECCVYQSKVLSAIWMHPYLGLWCRMKITECHFVQLGIKWYKGTSCLVILFFLLECRV